MRGVLRTWHPRKIDDQCGCGAIGCVSFLVFHGAPDLEFWWLFQCECMLERTQNEPDRCVDPDGRCRYLCLAPCYLLLSLQAAMSSVAARRERLDLLEKKEKPSF